MLVLTRKSDESIIIGNEIEIKVLKVQGNQVHLGITAPRSISVYRHEIYAQVKNENQTAVQKTINFDEMGSLESSLGSFKKLIDDKSKATSTKI